MSKWIKPYSNLPVTKATVPATTQNFEAKLAAFKKAHGFKERYSMLCHCSRFGRPFQVVFEREDAGERFVVGAVNKLGEYAAGGSGSAASQEQRFDINQFDTGGWHCPWCSDRSWVWCGNCGRNNCQHRFRQAGGGLYRCEPGCGYADKVGRMTEIKTSAASNAPAIAKGRAASALPGPKPSSLPRPDLPRLTGK